MERYGWIKLEFETEVKNKSRGHAICLNGISGGGLGATDKSALIEGCEMTEILGNAIQFIP